MNIHSFCFNLFREHSIVAWKEGKDCILIDPGFVNDAEKREMMDWMDENGMHPKAILLTHGHIDHISGVRGILDRFGQIPVYMSSLEDVILEYNLRVAAKLGFKAPGTFNFTDVKDGDVIEHAGLRFKVITTPGHTPGGVCYLEESEKTMFTGDTLFAGTIGRTDFEYSSYDDEIRSIMEKLIFLDGDIEIYPGHGDFSTIARERSTNPFLEPFNEKEELEGLASDELPHN